MTPTKLYRLTPAQSKILSSKKRFICINAGRRFGKTWVSGAKIVDKGINHDRKKIIYCAPTHEMARQLMWDGWLKEHIPEAYIAHKHENRMDMWLKNNSVIYLRSADNPERLRGLAADLLIVDEAAMISASFYDIVRPVLSDKYHDGEAMYISTPRGYNWFYDRFQEGLNDPKNWDTFQFTTLQGGNVTEEEIEQAKKEMSPKMFAQEYLASFETLSSRIYYAFDRNVNVCEPNEDWGKFGDIHVGMDFNVNPMTAEISVYENGKTFFFDEIVEPDSNTDEMAKTIKRRYPNARVFVYPDPTGKKRQTNAPVGMTDFEILRRHGFILCVPRVPYLNKDKENGVNAALLDAGGNSKVFIARGRCPELRKSWEGYARNEKGEPDKSSGLDHVADAAAYLILKKHPFYRNRKVRRPIVSGY